MSDTDVLPVGEIPEITLDDFMVQDTNAITLPEIGEEMLNKLVEKAIRFLKAVLCSELKQ